MLNIIKKNWRSQNINFLGKKIQRNAPALKRKKVQGIFGEIFIMAISSSAVFCLQNRVSDFFNLFCSEHKRLLSEVDFTNIINVSPNILVKN